MIWPIVASVAVDELDVAGSGGVVDGCKRARGRHSVSQLFSTQKFRDRSCADTSTFLESTTRLCPPHRGLVDRTL